MNINIARRLSFILISCLSIITNADSETEVNLPIGLSFQYSPIAVPFLTSYGPAISYRPFQALEVELSYRYSENHSRDDDSFWGDLIGENGTSEERYGAQLRFYPTQSFYMGFGIAHRTFRQDWEAEYFGFIKSGYSGTTQASAKEIRFSIGNQWRIKNVLVGIEWISYSNPYDVSVDQSVADQNASNRSEYEEIQDEEKNNSDYSNLNLLTLQLGVSF